MTTTARDIMTQGPECIGEYDTLLQAARKMRDFEVGALPICGEGEELKGIITDRDIVIRCLAEDRDPGSVTAGSFALGPAVTVGVDDPLEDVLATMAENQVRRLPVVDGDRLVGIISESDIAQNAPAQDVADTIDAVTES
jgi:CBS domain-containing protein